MKNFPEWLLGEIEKRGWTQAELARRAEVTPAQISRVLSQAQQPGPDTCTGIARALRISPEEVFRRAGLLPPQPEETPTSRELLYMFMQLDDQDQERILSITRTFLEEKKERVIIGGEEPAAA